PVRTHDHDRPGPVVHGGGGRGPGGGGAGGEPPRGPRGGEGGEGGPRRGFLGRPGGRVPRARGGAGGPRGGAPAARPPCGRASRIRLASASFAYIVALSRQIAACVHSTSRLSSWPGPNASARCLCSRYSTPISRSWWAIGAARTARGRWSARYGSRSYGPSSS